MNVPIRLASNASRICRQCRRQFSTTSKRNDMLADLERQISGKPAPQPTTRVTRITNNAGTPIATTTRTPDGAEVTTPGTPQAKSDAWDGIRDIFTPRQPSQPPSTAAPEEKKPDIFSEMLSGMDRAEAASQLENQQARSWRSGDVYSTHDLGPREGKKWAMQRKNATKDVFEMTGIDPRKHYKNMSLLNPFVSETGRIMHSRFTGLKPKNQRKLAKAVKRAMGVGLMPATHKHPEVIAKTLGIQDHLKQYTKYS